MTVRTNATDVKIIMDNVTLLDTIVNSYIISANAMVTDVLGGSGIAEATLTEIERWIAAHLITVTRERTAKKEAAGPASIEYAGEFGTGLSSTAYGQAAIALDYTGKLANLGNGRRQARMNVIPTVY